ncbi:hypothetical protein, partial [Deinococcus wulumuqiensis]|uniref:hypothetical protein n=1 Tax=Deinococcus wulumuqiensis TaxID=980427 RepID=UPI001CEF70E7
RNKVTVPEGAVGSPPFTGHVILASVASIGSLCLFRWRELFLLSCAARSLAFPAKKRAVSGRAD